MWKWEAVTLYSMCVLNGALSVLCIGRPKQVTTPGMALFGLAVLAGETWLIYRLAIA